jgi:hypothetical protein
MSLSIARPCRNDKRLWCSPSLAAKTCLSCRGIKEARFPLLLKEFWLNVRRARKSATARHPPLRCHKRQDSVSTQIVITTVRMSGLMSPGGTETESAFKISYLRSTVFLPHRHIFEARSNDTHTAQCRPDDDRPNMRQDQYPHPLCAQGVFTDDGSGPQNSNRFPPHGDAE